MLSLPAVTLPDSIEPYLALMFVGFVVGALGHLVRSRWLVAFGVIVIFLAVLLFPLAANLVDESPEPPGPVVAPP